jgi:hypothetical protein
MEVDDIHEERRYRAMCHRAKHSPIKERRMWYYDNHHSDADAKLDECPEIRAMYYKNNPRDKSFLNDESVIPLLAI